MDKKVNSESPSWKMIVKMKTIKPNSITLIHNHPKGTTFSISDVVSLNNTNSLKELVVKGYDGSEYYFSIPESAKINMKNKSDLNVFRQYVYEKRLANLKRGIDSKEANHYAWESIANERGWIYGKK